MTNVVLLLCVCAITLLATYLPGFVSIRVMGGRAPLALALAPGLSMALAGITAIIAPWLGLRWGLIPFALAAGAMVLSCAGLRRLGFALPATRFDQTVAAWRSLPGRWGWFAAICLGLAIAIGPIAAQARTPGAILERYDALFHLTALAHIRETGNGSSLALNSITNTAGTPMSYPAAFHDLASLSPIGNIPILLNGSTLALVTIPWILGNALLAAAALPRTPWAAPVVGVAATVVPASPLNLWIHLSPIPNVVGFAALPGLVAGTCAIWTHMLRRAQRSIDDEGLGFLSRVLRVFDIGSLTGMVLVVIAVGGLALVHPNVAITALIVITILTATTTFEQPRRMWGLLMVQALTISPVAVLALTPLGARATGFSGGLQVSLPTALAELVFGLYTVWPMAFGVVLALLWWPGIVRGLSTPARWLSIAWLVFGVLYIDAAIDSPLNLSALYFRGQDRIAIPLAMLSIALIPVGLQVYSGALTRWPSLRATARTPLAALAWGSIAVIVAATSIPSRSSNAELNLAREYPGRGRFLQADEVEEFAKVLPALDPDRAILASPFSGAAHMYAIHGANVHFPAPGMALRGDDVSAINAAEQAGSSPEQCQILDSQGIGYVYQERSPYQYDPRYAPINAAADELGSVVFETDHSRLIEIDCETSQSR